MLFMKAIADSCRDLVIGHLNPAHQNPSERATGLEQGELDARRAAIDRQDTWIS
jgi:hypothetical protein